MVIHLGIKLRHIRLFLQIAELGSLTAAARAAGLSQPAVSKSLAELEVLLGTPLFQRIGRRLILTAEGERFRRHARDAVGNLDAAARAVGSTEDHPRLSVGLLPTVSTRFFPAIVGQFLQDRPAVTLSIETGSHPVLLRKLRDRHIDLMIGRMPHAAEMAGLDFAFLYEEPIIAVVRSGHPLIRQPIARLLREVPLVLPTRDSIIRRTVDDYLASLGLADLAPAVETSTLALGRGLLLASDAIWFISSGVVEAEVETGQLVSIPLGATYLSGAVGMTQLAGHMRSAALSRLMALAEHAADARNRAHGVDFGSNIA